MAAISPAGTGLAASSSASVSLTLSQTSHISCSVLPPSSFLGLVRFCRTKSCSPQLEKSTLLVTEVPASIPIKYCATQHPSAARRGLAPLPTIVPQREHELAKLVTEADHLFMQSRGQTSREVVDLESEVTLVLDLFQSPHDRFPFDGAEVRSDVIVLFAFV